jgi:hypothetical protein
MAAGFPLDKANLDSRMGNAVLQLRVALDECQAVADLLADTDRCADAALTAMGYVTADITTMRAAFTALANLRSVAHGTRTQAAVNDFFYDAKKLTGVR